MKITFTFLLSIFFQLVFRQENLTLVDTISQEPVPNVYVYLFKKNVNNLLKND